MKQKKEFALREIAGETLLLPVGKTALDTNGIIALNVLGAEIWALLPEAVDEEDIVQRLYAEYDAPMEVIRADVAQFMGKLRGLAII